MSTRQFDGPTLEAALAKVRNELGADARITGAEKVRQGGIGGFFSRERVEVTVEIGADEPTAPVPVIETRTPASILDLADAISDDEMSVSTESPSFAKVLQRIASEADVAVAAQTALDPTPQSESERNPEPIPDPTPAPAPAPAPLPNRAAIAAAPAPAPAPAPVRAPRPLVVPRPAALATVSPHAPQLEKLGLPGALMPMDATHGLHCALVDALAELPSAPPLPAGRGTVLAVVGERSAALEIARELAVDLRLHPDDVVMCAPRRHTRAGDPTVELTTPEDADDHRRSWRRRIDPTIVVLDAPANPRDRGWARDMLAALEPTSAWGVANATRKLEDLAAWADDLGGIDALAVTNLADTVSPASVLQLGVPVAVLDGEPASPELWADILMERLAA